MSSLSVVTVTYNSSHILSEFIGRLFSEGESDSELVVVDSGSADLTQTESIVGASNASLIRSNENVGYGRGNNIGVRSATADWVFFVNPDVDVTFAQLHELVLIAEERGLTCVGPVIREEDGSIRSSWGRTVTPPWRRRSTGWREDDGLIFAETISGCCMGLRREDFLSIGGFDESFFMFSEEMDLHRRIGNKGLTIACVKSVAIFTPGGSSSEGVTNRWRLVERAVGHTKYVTKHFSAIEGFAALAFNALSMVGRSSFSPKGESLSQFWRGLRKTS